ncbi:MAG: zf-TFIIB domain-containing protein [Myxococcales bacterium]|nr:zf-TFIIB domain-containing protein [Myxococcales bacterium]
MRRPTATEGSRQRAARIAEALAGLLEDDAIEPRPRAARGALRCPGCGAPMVTLAGDGGVELDRCDGCGGVWLDRGELERLTERPHSARVGRLDEVRAAAHAHVAAPEGELRYRDCPRCQAVMQRRNFAEISGIILDECRDHGQFLDAGELEAIETFVRLGGLDLAAQAAQARALRAARRSERDRSAVTLVGESLSRPIETQRRSPLEYLLELLLG